MADGVEAVAWAMAQKINESELAAGETRKTREEWLGLVAECLRTLRR